MNREVYNSPLNTRYASKEMSYIFSDIEKFKTFRTLWTELAKAERELGLNITLDQIKELEENIDNIDFDKAAEYEKELRHDVMAHVKTYGEVAKSAAGIIHLGATSCYVTDNTDIIVMKNALKLIANKLAVLIKNLSEFADKYKSLPTLGYTHYQPAQLVTVGKRATLWIQDFLMDLEEIEYRINHLRLRGVKGTTGTQASFLELFDGEHEKVKELESKIVKALGFEKAVYVSGQTYTRKIDFQVLQALSQIAQSAHKMTNDLRLLQNLKEVEEPFEKNQIGSSAMAYKRNPMRSERIASLAKYVINIAQNPAMVEATQWFERTLDDSANKRLSVPECFLATDAILEIAINVTSGLVVHEKVIEKHVEQELPFMATENILMEAVKRGGDRQELHEKIRQYSMVAASRVKDEGKDNNLLELLVQDEDFAITEDDIKNILNPKKFIGRSEKQVEEFLKEIVNSSILDYDTQYKVNLKV
ncbi:adenylosuccinate lyase [Peptoniphilus asaccharolyticus DSM 20463]|uniref:Adenylosuccinate lyase n=1 Tax=Peptoniphilus asaccharolyticus DSM 20463 TaxID=573058 RepID=A0A1W1UY76_PEPAS|nr:adenylosuccinate lyase [Peptoniphilus asaccharolyticus]MBL7575350.1 adenylosuccinate lyase [Peptoniphilus asaccharolyticus]SMB86068.1 adenylosuccinate lyase [Peptoniphilus asaccharolyticus DSM 20463]